MSHQIRFGNWSFDPDTHSLWCGSHFSTLEPRIARLLEFFVARQDELVTHDDLVEAIWYGRVVSDETVRKGVSTLRRALARGGGKAYIKTVYKRGYMAHFPPAEPVMSPTHATRRPRPCNVIRTMAQPRGRWPC